MFAVRHAETTDLPQVASWLKSVSDCTNWAGSRVLYPVQVPSLAHDIKWEIATSMGLFADERLVGFGQIVPKLNERLHLARLIIDPTMRGRGLGRELTSRLLQTASRNGARVISLNVVRDNTPAVTLYRALGFQERERPGDEMRSTSIYMERCPT